VLVVLKRQIYQAKFIRFMVLIVTSLKSVEIFKFPSSISEFKVKKSLGLSLVELVYYYRFEKVEFYCSFQY
jgi:hypothetical protein